MPLGGELYKTTPLRSNETESTMLQPAKPSSHNHENNIRSDDTTMKVLNNKPVKDSGPLADCAADVSRSDIAPLATPLPDPNTDETISSKPIETINNEAAITSTGSDGINDIALTFPQRVSRTRFYFGNPKFHSDSM